MFKVDNNNISMIRGDSGVFTITITDTNGNPVELTESDVLTFTLRRAARNPAIVLQKKHCWRRAGYQPSRYRGADVWSVCL